MAAPGSEPAVPDPAGLAPEGTGLAPDGCRELCDAVAGHQKPARLARHLLGALRHAEYI